MLSKSQLHNLMLMTILLVASHTVQAQTIQGSTSVNVGPTYTYTYDVGYLMTGVTWKATLGTVTSTWVDGTQYSATVTWNTVGTGGLQIKSTSDGILDTRSITITSCSISNPTINSSSFQRCAAGSLNLQATAGSGGNTIKWYSTSSGGSALATATSYNIPSLSVSTTYYLTSFNTTTGCESTPRLAATATINPLPVDPWVTSTGSVCGNGSSPVNVPLSAAALPADVAWYSDKVNGTVGNGSLATGPNYNPSIVSTTNFYIAAYDPNTNCETKPANRLTVVATVRLKPTAAVSNQSLCSGLTTNIDIINPNNVPGTTFSWTVTPANVNGAFNSSGNKIAQTLATTTNTTGTATYYITPVGNSCTGSTITAVATVNPIPDANAASPTLCSGNTTNINITGSVAGIAFSWTATASNPTNLGGYANGSGPTIAQTLTNSSNNAIDAVTYAITPTANGCTGGIFYASATVNPLPTVSAANQTIFASNTTSIALAASTSSSFNYRIGTSNNISNAAAGTANPIAQAIVPADGANPGNVTYNVTATANGCTGPATNVTATVYPAPQLRVNSAPATAGGTYYNNYGYGNTLSVQGIYAAYQWLNNGQAIGGANSASHVPLLGGNYTVQVTATAGGPTAMAATITIAQPTMRDSLNSVSRTVFYKPGSDNVSPFTMQPSDLQQSVAYTDGLGRAVQTVAVGQATPTGQAVGDLVMPAAPGRNGLTDSTFLPYATTSVRGTFRKNAVRGSAAVNSYTTSEQYNFYQGTGKVATDAAPYARALFRNTPDARVVEQGAPGTDWQPGSSHTVRNQKNLATTTTYPVRQWKADGTTTGNYPNNTVWVTTLTDENNHNVNIYQDKFGRTVLKQVQATASTWLSTYYIYDNFGQLVYQLPPRAVTTLGTGTSLNANSSTVAKLIYQYKYDSAGQLIEKRVPGSAVMYMVYDKLGRVVLTQDGNQRAQGVWAFVKYDYKNRPVYTGTYISAADRLTLQRQFANLNYTTQPWFETRAANATYHGYSNTVFPTSSMQLLTVNYYDDYDFDYNNVADYAYDASDYGGTATNNTRGLATGSKKLILGTANWLVTVVFYDNLDRPLQTRSNSHLNLTVADRASLQYFANNLSSKPQRVKVTHTGLTTVTTTQRYAYDNAWRTTAIYHTINSNTEQQVAAYEYNALGQLVDKKLHVTGGGNFLQSVDYRYTIRGWLRSINGSQLTVTGDNDDTNDYFGMELLYNTADASGLGNSQNYNGNISATKWKALNAAGAADQRGYKYAYDYSDRLTSATFAAHTGSAWAKEANTLNESMTYDANGNIVNLQRNQNNRGLSGATVTNSPMTVDQLTYTYTANANTVAQVEDAVAATVGVGDFKNGSTTTSEYTYNTDGDLTKDLNKGISSITYNVLGKPTKVTYSGTPTKTVTYTYDAGGNKIKMVTVANSVTTTADYVGGFVYTNNTLSFFSSPEGRVVKNGSNYEYQYAIADHQGNTRVLFSANTPTPNVLTATFEGDANDNSNQYTSVNGSNVVPYGSANNTPGGVKVVRMNQTYPTGPGKSLKVYAGDKVDMEVWAYYEAASGYGTTNQLITAMVTSIAGAFGGVSGGAGESGNIYNGVNSALTNLGAGANQGDNAPSAHLNYILFDQQYKVLNAGWQVVPTTANWAKQKVSIPTVNVKEAGFIFVYLTYGNQSNNWVYFDDLKVTQTKTNVVQYNEYYPYGLQTANSWTRENTVQNNFLANGGTELNTATQLYDLDFRNYDPILGRLNQVDPLADKYASQSPYHFANNNPVTYTDPNGLSAITNGTWDPWGPRSEAARDQVRDLGGSTQRGNGGDSFWDIVGRLFGFSDGGYWVNNGAGNYTRYGSQTLAFYAASDYVDRFGLWGNNGNAASFEASALAFAAKTGLPVPLRDVTVTGNRFSGYRGEPYSNTAWLTERLNRAWGIDRQASNDGFNPNSAGMLGFMLETSFHNGADDAIKLATYTRGATNVAKGLGFGLTAVNAGLTTYAITQEYNQGKINTHSFVNGGIALVTAGATIATAIIGVATAPIWLTGIGVGGAIYGVVYGIDQLSGGMIGIDKGIDNLTNNWGQKFNK